MPVVSPSRFSSASSSSYRSSLSGSSLDRPYYSSATGSYVPRSSLRTSAYAERTTEFRSHRFSYESKSYSGGVDSYSSSRFARLPVASDSDSGVSGVSGPSGSSRAASSRSDRSSPGRRSREASASRSDSIRSGRDAAPKPYMGAATAELYSKYSPANYVPLAQRLSAAVTGPNGDLQRTSKATSESGRPPQPSRRVSRPHEPEVKSTTTRPQSHAPTNTDGRHVTNVECVAANDSASTNRRVRPVVDAKPKECAQRPRGTRPSSDAIKSRAPFAKGRPAPPWTERRLRLESLSVSDDNGNDLPLSVSDIRRKFDPKMTVTRLPARDPELFYGSTLSSDNIYGRIRSLDSGVDDKPVPVHRPTSSEKYSNGIKWDFSTDSGTADNSKNSSNAPSVRKSDDDKIASDHYDNRSNANASIGKTIEVPKVITVEIEIEKGPAVQNDSPSEEIAPSCDSGKGHFVSEFGSKHTSDFASYIRVSPPPDSPSKKRSSALRNGEIGSDEPDREGSNEGSVKNCIRSPSPDREDASDLGYIDSEPGLDGDSKSLADYNDRDDDAGYEEEGFENKTFEYANGHLLGRSDDVDHDRISKLSNGVIKMADDISDDEDNIKINSKDGDYNCNERYGKDSNPCVVKRKYVDINGDSSPSQMFQIYQKDSSSTGKSSPSNSLVPSNSSVLINSNNSTPCGTLTTTSRRRSVDSKSPQPGGETVSRSSGLNGLRNIGNTCFMNSVVQCLSNTKLLLEYCGSPDAFTPDINTTLSCMKGALIKAFSTVITELWKADETDGVVNTTSLKAQIQRFAPRFMGYSQQDAQEFLRYLLEGLHEDVNRVTIKPKPILTEIDENLSDAQKAQESWQRYLRSEDSRVGDIFVGQLKSSLRCTHCSHTSVTFDPFWDLSLPIPSRTGQLKLTQCLSHFTREEELDGDEKPTCSKCQVRRKCLKWFTVQKFPKVLVLHLKRFSPTERFRGKLNVSVDFPLSGLDMTPYAASISNNSGPPPPAAIYNLYAVSNHSGTTYSGHYTAYCKHPYNGEWHEYNDSRVSPISPKNVVTSEAYVLFYELVSGSAAS